MTLLPPHNPSISNVMVIFAERYTIPIRHLMICFLETRRLRRYGTVASMLRLQTSHGSDRLVVT
jgi:hypothetical protein